MGISSNVDAYSPYDYRAPKGPLLDPTQIRGSFRDRANVSSTKKGASARRNMARERKEGDSSSFYPKTYTCTRLEIYSNKSSESNLPDCFGPRPETGFLTALLSTHATRNR